MRNFFKYVVNGIFKENPVLILMIGLCSVLAVSTSVENAIGMGLAFSFVMIFSNLFVSLLRPITPNEIRIPIFIIVIGTFTTIVDLVISAYFPELYKALGIFIPLIVVNCIIIGRAEAFAYRHSVLESVADGIGISLGYIWAIVALGLIREFLGNGTILGKVIFSGFDPAKVFTMPPGAFWGIGLLIGLLKWFEKRVSRR
ncbi:MULTISPECIES: electron transport complex subunit RsxE [Dictyoglomus]|jgi:electron transport complex protein RnfE|uniref:Ion-translocating oxidoreductase complex subunit E n=1 Tax=Dictyoglomus turgidum (strain DSM 6724 / Z-1310) TaxID=515635 RepID=B8E296_DICTD|nr:MULTISPECIES: electron transport complex subunit RsxE [Dictyoglomus]ACK42373.1 electron transport complex, RnfABCDGE type, E subunit [Dictyoglomus turgidum DSM 6724]PNV80372.1 MAG: electron transport complex subunit RsxE [Dictyoglomus turgidum]HBU32171.1 RnfABCDGE type electron transport complex subunit E [Dictyoglomus sp.]